MFEYVGVIFFHYFVLGLRAFFSVLDYFYGGRAVCLLECRRMLQIAAQKIDCDCDALGLFELVRAEDACLLSSGGRGRFSFVGFEPFLKVEAKDGQVMVKRREGENLEFEGEGLDVLQDFLDEFHVERPEELKWLPFCGGAIGYLSYDYGVHLMNVEQSVKDDVGTADLSFGFFDKFFVVDGEKEEVWGVALGINEVELEERLLRLARIVSGEEVLSEFKSDRPRGEGFVEPKSNLSQEEYVQKISEIKDLLRRGESYEVNFAQRFSGRTGVDSWQIYRNLFEENPSPFMCYFQNADMQIVSNSPERLVNCRDGVLETRPIKGTAPRGETVEEDEKLAAELLASEKNAAELNMIVDLARNDLGQVAEAGTVEVTEHRVIEKYSHVQHTMSNVRAKKRGDASFADVVRAMFPGGSVTGAPKKRTMEIIDELEEYRRGVYCGSAGYVSFSGDFDFNIMIRTLTNKDGQVYFHSGGAVVIDSVGEEEWQETLDKAGALMGALE